MSLILADARQIPLRDGCVQCVVTSPPYFGLRDYGTANQIGLEPTPDAFVAALVAVFREVRRVLADDGVCWLNLGDSYAASSKGSGGMNSKQPTNIGSFAEWSGDCGVAPKNLLGIPWRVAFALQADGWYLRQDIIWSKPNPMPESVTDRCTKAHEYVFLMSRSARYFCDMDAIAEPFAHPEMQQEAKNRKASGALKTGAYMEGSGRNDGASYTGGVGFASCSDTRNKRSVWTIATKPYSEAHFATMPEKLVEPCILAGSRLGDRVFDPFIGSGTVGAVAERLGRRWVGTDLNPKYHALARKRTAQRGLRFEVA